MSLWMLCPAAHEEARSTGLVYRCEGRRNHVCNGERTPYLWDARGAQGKPFKSEQPCCSSCMGDEEYDPATYGRGLDEHCCCVHGQEWDERAEKSAPSLGEDSPSPARVREVEEGSVSRYPTGETVEDMLKDWPPHMKLPEKFNDKRWWCMEQPGCNSLACAGHPTFTGAVRLTIRRIRSLRATGTTS